MTSPDTLVLSEFVAEPGDWVSLHVEADPTSTCDAVAVVQGDQDGYIGAVVLPNPLVGGRYTIGVACAAGQVGSASGEVRIDLQRERAPVELDVPFTAGVAWPAGFFLGSITLPESDVFLTYSGVPTDTCVLVGLRPEQGGTGVDYQLCEPEGTSPTAFALAAGTYDVLVAVLSGAGPVDMTVTFHPV